MDDGGILFDETTWRTHILTAAAALVYETLVDASSGQAIAMDEATRLLREQLEFDPAAAETSQLLAMLQTLGLIR